MKVFRTIREFREYRAELTGVGFVPTMGALHLGHATLMEKSVSENAVTVASIFVNPLQFGPKEDLSKYPRQEAEDIELATNAGVTAIFCPSVEEMVGSIKTSVSVSGVSEFFEGEKRPGHFDGVATIVARLFGAVCPDRAYFGFKDLQQCAVIQQMVTDLCIPVELRFVETIREPDGLAMSSRNAYLSAAERGHAANVYRILKEVAEKIRVTPTEIDSILDSYRSEFTLLGFELDYLEVVDPKTMRESRNYPGSMRVIVAARLGNVRLIDNVAI